MSRLEQFWRYEFVEWLVNGIFGFYATTVGIGPAVCGYVLGRWVPAIARAVPLAFVLYVGYLWTDGSGHWFGVLVWGNMLYAICCAVGLHRRARDRGVAFWSLYHYDWVTVLLATLLMIAVYVPPGA